MSYINGCRRFDCFCIFPSARKWRMEMLRRFVAIQPREISAVLISRGCWGVIVIDSSLIIEGIRRAEVLYGKC